MYGPPLPPPPESRSGRRLDLDAYLSWMRLSVDGKRVLHLGCLLTPAEARLAAERLTVLADEIEESA
jgi:hypothetical protein